jgi:protein-disulfide isomerase
MRSPNQSSEEYLINDDEGRPVISHGTRLSKKHSRIPAHEEPTFIAVSVIQYGDFQCVACGRAATTIKSFRERFGTQILFAYRHFPQDIIHPLAVQASEAAECARAQGRFWPMHDLMMANQERLELQYLYGYAEQLRLEMNRFTAEMDDEVHLPTVRAHIAGGTACGVQSTPTFLVDGQIVDISSGLRSLFEATEYAVNRAREVPQMSIG